MAGNAADRTKPQPARDDARADRRTFAWIAFFFSAFLIVDVLSRLTETARFNLESDPSRFALFEISSLVLILALFPLVSAAVTRATPGQQNWRFVILFHLAASLLFSVIHIAGMVALRKLAFPVLYDARYVFTDNLAREFIYEYRKDLLTYLVIVFFIAFGRHLAQQRRELEAAREDAKETKKLTLKCGGRVLMVSAADVRWVKAASNYVEVAANGATHLARSTLAAIEGQLQDAGVNAVRVHRSHVVNIDHIAGIKPTGEGDVRIEMTDGAVIPGSRRYRDRLPQV